MPKTDRPATVAAVEAERRDLADLLADLAPDEWAVPSLCGGWTVREVVAHLTTATRWTVWSAVRGIVRARGDLDRLFHEVARERAAAYGPAELVEQLRATASSTLRFPGAAVHDPLVDVLVHGQDIARPLGRVRPMPVERVQPVLAAMWNSPFYGGRTRLAGVRLVATDADWSAGDGVELRGPAGDLLLVATGRRAGLDALAGDGVSVVAARMDR